MACSKITICIIQQDTAPKMRINVVYWWYQKCAATMELPGEDRSGLSTNLILFLPRKKTPDCFPVKVVIVNIRLLLPFSNLFTQLFCPVDHDMAGREGVEGFVMNSQTADTAGEGDENLSDDDDDIHEVKVVGQEIVKDGGGGDGER